MFFFIASCAVVVVGAILVHIGSQFDMGGAALMAAGYLLMIPGFAGIAVSGLMYAYNISSRSNRKYRCGRYHTLR